MPHLHKEVKDEAETFVVEESLGKIITIGQYVKYVESRVMLLRYVIIGLKKILFHCSVIMQEELNILKQVIDPILPVP